MQLTNGKVESIVDNRLGLLSKVDTPARLAQAWPKVRIGCLAVKMKDKQKDNATWDVGHIRAQLDATFLGRSTAELWEIKDKNGNSDGFLVTIIGNCPYKQVPQSLIVWVAYTWRPVVWFGLSGLKRARAILAQLEQYARDRGLDYVDGYALGTNIRWMRWLDRVSGGRYRIAQLMFRCNVWDK